MPKSRTALERVLIGVGIVVGLVVLFVLTIVITTRKGATDTENALWTFITFALGIAASFYFGRVSVRDAAAEIVRPQARGAARRLVAMGRGIRSFSDVVELQREAATDLAAQNSGSVPLRQVLSAFDLLELQSLAQLAIVGDALEDWREFEPEIVNSLVEETER